jgi:hypothetical protein
MEGDAGMYPDRAGKEKRRNALHHVNQPTGDELLFSPVDFHITNYSPHFPSS